MSGYARWVTLKVSAWECRCARCGHEWQSLGAVTPRACASCKALNWTKPSGMLKRGRPYAAEARKLTADDVVFFQKCSAVKTFSSSPAGFKAAHKHARALPASRPSAMGTWALRYTVEELCMESRETYGTDPARPVRIEYVYAVVLWQALTEPKA